MLHWVEPSYKMIRCIATVFIAFSTSIAKWNSSKVDVTVSISSDITKEASTAAFITCSSKFVAASSWMAGEEFDEEHW